MLNFEGQSGDGQGRDNILVMKCNYKISFQIVWIMYSMVTTVNNTYCDILFLSLLVFVSLSLFPLFEPCLFFFFFFTNWLFCVCLLIYVLFSSSPIRDSCFQIPMPYSSKKRIFGSFELRVCICTWHVVQEGEFMKCKRGCDGRRPQWKGLFKMPTDAQAEHMHAHMCFMQYILFGVN